MKNHSILLFLFLLVACSGAEKNNLNTFKNIQNMNGRSIASVMDNAGGIYMQGLMPGMKDIIKPYNDRKEKMLAAGRKLYNAISADIKGILLDNDLEVDIKSEQGFEILSVDANEINDQTYFSYSKGEWICKEMEKLCNNLFEAIHIHSRKELPYYSRPETEKSPEPDYNEVYSWPAWGVAPKMANLLLVPIKNENGDRSGEKMFEGMSMLRTIENLCLLQQRVILAMDHAMHCLFEVSNRPEYTFNKTEPVVCLSPARKDSALLRVFIAAYDSTDVPIVHYTVDGGKEQKMRGFNLVVPKTTKQVDGHIQIRCRGEVYWKPWRYNFK